MHDAAHHAPGLGAAALLLALFGLLALYVYGALRQRRRGRRWQGLRVLSFGVGVALLALAVAPPVLEWAHHDLRGHMAQHLLLGMLAPLGLVLAAPGTLLLRNLPRRGARALVDLLGQGPIPWLVHPITAALLDIGGMYVLYLTPLYAASLGSPVLHVFVHVHFVISGCLFTWAIAGPDPAPHRPGMWTRLVVLFLATAAHGLLAKIMYAYGWPRGTTHSLEEIQAAAQWMYYGGDLAELLLAAAFFTLWFGQRRRREFGSRPPAALSSA